MSSHDPEQAAAGTSAPREKAIRNIFSHLHPIGPPKKNIEVEDIARHNKQKGKEKWICSENNTTTQPQQRSLLGTRSKIKTSCTSRHLHLSDLRQQHVSPSEAEVRRVIDA